MYQPSIIKKTKKDYRKKLVKDIKVFMKNKNKKCVNVVVNDTKIYQKMKSKSLLSIKKIIK